MDLKCHLGLFRTEVMRVHPAQRAFRLLYSNAIRPLSSFSSQLGELGSSAKIPARERIGARGSNPRAREK